MSSTANMTQVAEGVHRGAAVIGDHRRREKARQLQPAMTVRRAQHGDFDAHVAQARDAVGPVPRDGGTPLEFEAQFDEERNRGIEVFDHDADVVHALDGHEALVLSK